MTLEELQREYAEELRAYKEFSENPENAIEEIRSKNEALRAKKQRIELMQEDRSLELAEVAAPETRKISNEKEVRSLTDDELDKEYEGTFLRAFRNAKSLTKRDNDIYAEIAERRDAPTTTPYLKTAVDADGGFIVPHSVSTQIQEYKRQMEFDLTTLVTVQRTAVLSGEFTYEKLADIVPFENISQWDTINEVATPQFERKDFKISDYAGILPIPRTLLQDTDQNLLSHIAKFIARKSLVTRNAKILAVINATYSVKETIEDVDDFKDILNVTLDPAFATTATIVTNQDGFNYLTKMKDKNGNYLVQPDVTQPERKTISGHTLQVLPNRTLKSTGTVAPVYVGSFKDAIQFMDRGVYEVTPTTIGGDSFKRNSLDIRVIDRFDVVALDPAAVVAGEIDTSLPVDPVEP